MKCEACGKEHNGFYGSGRFCCRSCANVRRQTQKTKQKIANTIINNSKTSYLNNPKYCCICDNIIPYDYRKRSTCSEECKIIRRKQIISYANTIRGLHSAKIQQKRSKNEIAFCIKCEQYFGISNVLHNEPIFNGWDADIILPQYKLAILWNGPWHYYKITKQHNLAQVQNRDRIKIREIKNCGYTEYIIKDVEECDNKVEKEFNLLLKYLKIN